MVRPYLSFNKKIIFQLATVTTIPLSVSLTQKWTSYACLSIYTGDTKAEACAGTASTTQRGSTVTSADQLSTAPPENVGMSWTYVNVSITCVICRNMEITIYNLITKKHSIIVENVSYKIVNI